MLSGRYPSDDFADLRPRLTWDRLRERGHARARARSESPSPTAARFPIAASTACSSRASAAPGRASASSTRRWSSRAASARRSCSAPRAGASSRSLTTACSCRLPRASPARCRSGRRTRSAGRWSSDARSARSCARSWPCRLLPAIERLVAPPRSRRAGGREPAALSRRSDHGRRRRARRPHGAHRALPRRARRLARLRPLARSAAASTPRGRWPSSNAPAPKRGSTSKRCGPTTGSW